MKITKKKVLIIVLIVAFLLSAIGGFLLYKSLNKKQEKTPIVEEVIDENVENTDKLDNVNLDSKSDKNAIGYLTIESINLKKAPIGEGTEMSTLNKYIGHFTESAYLEGNVALAGHNRGYEKNYFANLKNIKKGDTIEYQTKSETKKYKVTEIKQIKETDVDVIRNTKDNRITLITCVENKPSLRICVVGEEIK